MCYNGANLLTYSLRGDTMSKTQSKTLASRIVGKLVALKNGESAPILVIIQKRLKAGDLYFCGKDNEYRILWGNGNNTWFMGQIIEPDKTDNHAYTLLKIYGKGLTKEGEADVEARYDVLPQFLKEYYPAVPTPLSELNMRANGSHITYWISPAGLCYPVHYMHHTETATSILLTVYDKHVESSPEDMLMARGYMRFDTERDSLGLVTLIKVQNVIENYQYPAAVNEVWEALKAHSAENVGIKFYDYSYAQGNLMLYGREAKEIYQENLKSLKETGKLAHA